MPSPQVLVDLLNAAASSSLAELADFLIRLENLSYILCWSLSNYTYRYTENVC
jgi:hypothetical protein